MANLVNPSLWFVKKCNCILLQLGKHFTHAGLGISKSYTFKQYNTKYMEQAVCRRSVITKVSVVYTFQCM